jgi:hypothetical protein
MYMHQHRRVVANGGDINTVTTCCTTPRNWEYSRDSAGPLVAIGGNSLVATDIDRRKFDLIFFGRSAGPQRVKANETAPRN